MIGSESEPEYCNTLKRPSRSERAARNDTNSLRTQKDLKEPEEVSTQTTNNQTNTTSNATVRYHWHTGIVPYRTLPYPTCVLVAVYCYQLL